MSWLKQISEASLLCDIWIHLCYASLVWAQKTSVKKLYLLQKKSLTIKFFQSETFIDCKLLKLFDKTALKNCILISKSLERLLLSVFKNWLKFYLNLTLIKPNGQMSVALKYPFAESYSMIVNAVYIWNHLQNWQFCKWFQTYIALVLCYVSSIE